MCLPALTTTSVPFLTLRRLLHFDPLTQQAAELSLAMIDVALQLDHCDTALFARHVSAIADLIALLRSDE